MVMLGYAGCGWVWVVGEWVIIFLVEANKMTAGQPDMQCMQLGGGEGGLWMWSHCDLDHYLDNIHYNLYFVSPKNH